MFKAYFIYLTKHMHRIYRKRFHVSHYSIPLSIRTLKNLSSSCSLTVLSSINFRIPLLPLDRKLASPQCGRFTNGPKINGLEPPSAGAQGCGGSCWERSAQLWDQLVSPRVLCHRGAWRLRPHNGTPGQGAQG